MPSFLGRAACGASEIDWKGGYRSEWDAGDDGRRDAMLLLWGSMLFGQGEEGERGCFEFFQINRVREFFSNVIPPAIVVVDDSWIRALIFSVFIDILIYSG